MKVEVFPSSVQGMVAAPGSKSIAQRMTAAALLARGETMIHNFPDSSDCAASLNIVQNLGGIVTRKSGEMIIMGGFPNSFHAGIRNPKSEIHCGESGLASRMFTPIAALHNELITITGEGSLLKRPFNEFESALPMLGAKVTTNQGHLPLTVHGPLRGGRAEIDGSTSSQFITGLLMALPRAAVDSELIVTKATSTPYLQTTLDVMQQFGVEVQHSNYSDFHIKSSQNYLPQTLTVPGDWSGAAFLLVAGALCADEAPLMVRNLSQNMMQADAAIIDAMKAAGIDLKIQDESIKVSMSDVNAFEFDANNCPDLFPPLAALAAFADGVSTIYGVKRLVYKESNRAKVLQEEFAKANIRITLRDNEMKIYPSSIRPAIINSHNDHRIAMAAALLGLGGAKMTIRGAECISKSFPDFFTVLQQAGGKIMMHQTQTV